MALTGTETMQVLGQDAKGQPAATTQTVTVNQIAAVSAPYNGGATYNAVSGNTPLQLTAANISGSSDVNVGLTAVLAGAGTATLPTAASLIAAIPNYVIGVGYNLRIINKSTGAFAWTIATNTGWTLNGTMTIAQNTSRDFVVIPTSATAVTLQEVGTGTDS